MVGVTVIVLAVSGVLVVAGALAIGLVASAEFILWRWEQRREPDRARGARGGGRRG